MFNLQDLMALKLRDVSLAQYNLEWDDIIAGVQKVPAEDVMEAFSTQIQRSKQFKNLWDLYNYDITCKQGSPSYSNLKELTY